jgi:CBS domain-containing protein
MIAIAAFVYIGADGETRAALARTLAGKLRVSDLMTSPAPELPAHLSVQAAAEAMLRDRLVALVAVAEGRAIGVVTVDAIQDLRADQRETTTIRKVATPTPMLGPGDDAGAALRIMNGGNLVALVVSQGNRPVGILTREDLARGLRLGALAESLAQRRTHAATPHPAEAPA